MESKRIVMGCEEQVKQRDGGTEDQNAQPLHGIVEWLGYAIEFVLNVHIAKTISYFCAALFLICAVVKAKSCYILLIRCQTTLSAHRIVR